MFASMDNQTEVEEKFRTQFHCRRKIGELMDELKSLTSRDKSHIVNTALAEYLPKAIERARKERAPV